MFFHSYTTNSNFGSFDNSFYSGFLIRTPSPGNMAKYFIIAELAARSVHSVAPLLYKILVTHEAKKNLDVRPYKVLLSACAANCTMGISTP